MSWGTLADSSVAGSDKVEIMTIEITVTFKITPEGIFGVPESGKSVVPAGEGTHHSEPLHVATGTITGHGTLSEFRSEDQKLVTTASTGGTRVKMVDNFAFVSATADSVREAYLRAVYDLDLVLQHLTVSQGRPFSFEVLVIEEEVSRTCYPVPSLQKLSGFATYDLELLSQQIKDAATFAERSDDRLKKALAYFDFATFLDAEKWQAENPLSRRSAMEVSSIFLNYWKAVTAIVGDPAVKKDRYQSRYKSIGLPDQFKERLKKLKRLRDDYDVAHYSLADEKLKKVGKSIGSARATAKEAIECYRKHLTERAGQPKAETDG